MNVSLLIAYISIFSAFIPLITGLFQLCKLSEKLKLIFWIVFVSALSDILSLVLNPYGINTWPIGNLFLIVQFTFLFLALNYEKNDKPLKIIFYACLIFAAINFIFIQSAKTFNSYTAYLAGILITLTSINFLYQLLAEARVEKVQTLPMFWIAFGALTYHAGTLFLFLFNNYLIKHHLEYYHTIWILHNLLNIIKNLFLFTALWMNYKGKMYSQ